MIHVSQNGVARTFLLALARVFTPVTGIVFLLTDCALQKAIKQSINIMLKKYLLFVFMSISLL
jgi:hypothetical protein